MSIKSVNKLIPYTARSFNALEPVFKADDVNEMFAQLRDERDALANYIESLRSISEAEYSDEDERDADIDGILEQAPQQILADRDGMVAFKAYRRGYEDAGDHVRSEGYEYVQDGANSTLHARAYAERIKVGEV